MMNLEDQALFFFSALGAFNGLFLSVYFAFLYKKRGRPHYFLAALLFVISVRVTKSVFMTFYADTSNAFIQVGLTACFLIGPFLYLYVHHALGRKPLTARNWLLHVLPITLIMMVIGVYFPYKEYRWLWQRTTEGYLCWPLFAQWLAYIIYSGYLIKGHFNKLFTREQRCTHQEIWLISLVGAMAFIWLAYFTNGYTSYIVGALSFSFTFYITIFIWVLKRGETLSPKSGTPRYANKKINEEESQNLQEQLQVLLNEKKLFKNHDLKLSDLARELKITPHFLSQYLNDNLGKSFAHFINEYRVDAAKLMILEKDHLTIEAIGYECGFNSNSSFYAAFKKFTGSTPAHLKKTLA